MPRIENGARHLSLVGASTKRPPRPMCEQTIRACETLLKHARDGSLVGLALVKFMPSHAYSVDIVGLAQQDPTWARGAVAAIDDELSDLIHEAANNADEAEW